METIGKIMSAGLITGAVFTLFLYSPVASPELYTSNNMSIVIVRPDVSLEGKGNKSTRLRKSRPQENSGLQISDPFSESQNNLVRKETGANKAFTQNPGNAENRYATSRSTESQTGGNNSFSGGRVAAASGRSTAYISSTLSYGFLALNTDRSIVGSTSQSATSDENNDITNPGDDPVGDVLPLSDGLGLLLLMAVGFGGWKKFKN